ncbi:MAG: phosphatase PAP2 family protein [Deltaproteobacteria bacterium]|nr:phosphatase PAP2 family protein [Deltaproteobacteria bacterium]
MFSYLIQEWKSDILQPRRIINGLLIFLLMPIYMSAFSSLKVNIPLINPFLWDHIFVDIDNLIHFGLPPWKILQPLLGYPFITNGINFFYHLWFIIMYGILFWQAFSLKNPQLRMQYLLSFLLLWMVLGSIMAITFASVGPCYYGRIFNVSDPFQHLMQYLWSVKEEYPLWALDVQEILWKDYNLGNLDKGRGISAMPSLHVATSVLFGLLGWKTNKILGILLTFFASVVLIGSVHLGWHYAIDGYVAVFCTILIWKFAGYFVQCQSKKDWFQ